MALIDRSRVMTDYLENLGRNDSYKAKYEALVKAVDDGPAIDAVPVVRCKDCVYRNVPKCCPCQLNGFKVTHDWYCPMGVRNDRD